MQGMILEVSTSPSGDELDSDHLTGATTLQLTDVSDFLNSDSTGSVEINGNVYVYTAYDEVLNTMTIAGPGLLADELAGERVNISPLVLEKWAMVEAQENDDVILALVPHSLWDKLDEGVREPEDQEAVVCELQNGDWTVANVLGSAPTVSGEFIAPGTVPELGELAAQVTNNTEQITLASQDIQNTAETAYQARDLANSADGRISMSDFDPTPGDVQYYLTDANGDLVLDGNGDPILQTRTQGSVWFTRTRARKNLCTNPSFEVSTAEYSPSQASVARVVAAGAVDGTYVLEVTNSGVAGPHYVSWVPGAGQVALPGQVWTVSTFAQLVSGAGNDFYITAGFYDSGLIPLAFYSGPTVDLLVDDWSRVSLTVQAPPNTAYIVASFGWGTSVGVESSVWRMDGVLVEQSAQLGRYFDGSSYDAVWDSLAELSTSTMEGGKIINIWELDDGAWIIKQFMGDTLQDINASEIKAGFMDGERLQDFSIPQDKMSAQSVVLAEAVTPGQLVHIISSGGSALAYLADADANRAAHGFVMQSGGIGESVRVYSNGYNPFITGMTPGPIYLSTTPGAVQSFPNVAVGSLQQRVGTAVASNVLNFTSTSPMKVV